MGKIQSMLTLDGESEYRRQLSLINANLKTLEKELAATSSQLTVGSQKLKQSADISANYGKQMEFLTAKQDILQKAMTNAEKEIENNNKKLTSSRQQYASATKQVETARNEVATWTKICGENSAEVNNAKAVLAKYEEEQKKAAKEVATAEKALDRAGKAYHSYRQQLADTNTAINRVTEAQRKQDNQEQQSTKNTQLMANAMKLYEQQLDQLPAKLEKVGSAMSKVASAGGQAFLTSVKAVTTELDLGIKGLEAYVGAVTSAATATVGFAASNGVSFESAMSKVQAYANLDTVQNAEEIKALTEAAKETGATTTKTATDAANALGYLALNGWKTEQMLSALLPVTKASEAGDMDLASVANLTARSLTAYGKSAEDAEDFLNILIAAQNNSSNSLNDLLTAYSDIAGTFAQLGVSMEESATILGVFANQGKSGAEASTALNSVMLRLLGTNKKSHEALEALGVTAWDDAGEFRGLTTVLRELGTALDALTTEEATQWEKDIGGVMRVQELQKLINGVMDEEQYNKVWDPINAAIENQTLYKTAEVMMENTRGKLELLKSATSALGTSIYETFSEDATGGAQKLTHWVDMLNDAVKDTSKNYEKIEKMQDLYNEGKVYSAFMSVSDLISPELAAELNGKGGLPAIMEEMYKRTETPIIDSIRSITARASTQLSAGITKTAKLLPGKLKIFNTSVEKGAELLIQGIHESKDTLLPEIIQGATDLALNLADYMPDLIDDVADGAEILFTGIIDGFDKVTDRLIENGSLDKLIDRTCDFFANDAVGLWEAGLSIVGKVAEGIDKHKDELIGTGLTMVNQIVDDVTENPDKILKKSGEIVGAIVTGIEDKKTLEKLVDAAVSLTTSLATYIGENLDTIIEECDVICTRIFDQLQTEDNLEKMKEAGKTLGLAVLKGIGTAISKWTDILYSPEGINQHMENIDTQLALRQAERYGFGTDVAAGTAVTANRPQASIRERNTGDNVTFNITGNNINDYNDIERLVEQGAVLYNNAMKAGGKR